ncbi:MAG: molecular chaperone [Methylococcales bacterium]|nr:molecular chaperone [Methylococcales bacterium]
MNVQPTVVELTSTGKNSSVNLRVLNDTKKPMPIEIVTYSIMIDHDGKVSEKEIEGNFLIFPPQKMIAPGTTQNFKVRWVGAPDLKSSESYRLSVNQMPVDNFIPNEEEVKKAAGVQVVFNYGVLVNVRPLEGKSDLTLVKSEIGKDAKGILRPILTLKNSSNIHARLSDATLNLSNNDWSKKVEPSSLMSILGVGLVQPGKTRRFILNIDIPKTLTELKTSIDYKSR